MKSRNNVRKLTILAQDPSVRIGGRLALAQVDVPHEEFSEGPTGYRVKVVDFDATGNVLYSSRQYERDSEGELVDPFAPPVGKRSKKAIQSWENALLSDPTFHAQNVYAIVMRTLARFEYALGRRVPWGFNGHQLHLAPHAFHEANAFYSEQDRALFFGYFKSPRSGKPVFTSLSHDIVAHETTHALLDGLRDAFTDPSTPDQAAFHEGFSDVVALLSIFSLPEIAEVALTKGNAPFRTHDGIRLTPAEYFDQQALADSILFGLGKEIGREIEDNRADCLRRSISLKSSRKYLQSEEYWEPHDRGEVFAAAMLRSFLTLWNKRIHGLGTFGRGTYNLDLVIEEGAKAADHLLTMAIRALDYCPVVDLEFGDYLAGLLTADSEAAPDDSRFQYRKLILDTFSSYGIDPPKMHTEEGTGCWMQFDRNDRIIYTKSHYDSMLHDPEEVFRFVWENRAPLEIDERGYTRIASVRPSTRQGPDGFMLRETVVEYRQIAHIFGAEAAILGIKMPKGMTTRQSITAYGGGTLIFDQYGRIKYHIAHGLGDGDRQTARLAYLWQTGQLDTPRDTRNQFAMIHRNRLHI